MSKSIEELLKLVSSKEKKEKKPREDNKNVLQFISDLGIESGLVAIPNYLIFYIYRNIWCPEESKKKAKKITFFQTFGKHFTQYRKNKQRFYMLKDGIFDVNDEVLKAAKIYDKQHWQSKKVQKKIQIP